MKRFKNILYFADGTTESSSTLQRAVDLARTNNARLTVLDVLAETESPARIQKQFGMDLNEILSDRRQELLEGMVTPFGEEEAIYTRVLTGTPFVAVIRAVLRNGYDLVIKEAHSPASFPDRLFGSTDMHLLRKCPCPVWIDRPDAVSPYRTILAAVDPVAEQDEACDRLIMDLATSLASRESARLAVVHAWRLYGESMLRNGLARVPPVKLERMLDETRELHREKLDQLLAPYALDEDAVNVFLKKGEPAACIHELSNEIHADLIILGTVGRLGVPGFFIGNTAEEVLQTTQASVLAVKPQGFVSPVLDE